jgi:ParB-like nuclease domain
MQATEFRPKAQPKFYVPEVEMVGVEIIHIFDGRRQISACAVDRLAESMSKIGLRTPKTVRREDMFSTPYLVAGAHRLEAAIKLVHRFHETDHLIGIHLGENVV